MSRTTDPPFDEAWLPAAAQALVGTTALRQALERWASAAVVDEAARGRARASWLRIQAESEATLVGVLVDLAEHGRPVALEVAGQRITGLVVGVGSDFAALRTALGQDVMVRTSVIDVVRAHPELADTVGDRVPLLETSFDAILGPVAADRPTVLVRTVGGTTVRGVLRSAGADAVHVRADGDPPTPTWIAHAAVASLVIDP